MNAESGLWKFSAMTLAVMLTAGPIAAQQGADSLIRHPSPTLVKYGKWALLAAAVGMGFQASSAHHDADRAFNRLTDYCFSQPAGCAQAANGKYLDPVAERYYQASLSGDRRARSWLLGGEVAVLGAAGMFVWELTRPKSMPRNIPFNPELEWTPTQLKMKGSVRF